MLSLKDPRLTEQEKKQLKSQEPKPTNSVIDWKPKDMTLKELQKESKVWKAIPTWSCKLCEGYGHIETQCGTKKNLDRIAKTMSRTEQRLWSDLKYKGWYEEYLKKGTSKIAKRKGGPPGRESYTS